MLKIFRYALSQAGWKAAAWAAAELLKWAILPEAEAAEMVVTPARVVSRALVHRAHGVDRPGARSAMTEREGRWAREPVGRLGRSTAGAAR